MTSNRDASIADELLEIRRILGWMDLIIGSINDAVCVVNKENKIVFSNNYFADMLGIHRVFLLGKEYDEVFPVTKIDEPLPEFINVRNKLAESESGEVDIYQLSDTHSSAFIFRISSRTLQSNDQTVYLIQNITSEYDLTKLKNDFINLASHQLRTPMTAIMTYSHMLSNEYAGKLNGKQQALVDTLINSSERMIRLIDSLLSITKVQSNGRIINKERMKIGEVFDMIYSELEPRIKKKKLHYTFSIKKGFPELVQDQSVLHEIFSNIIVNAIQYTKSGGRIAIAVAKKGANAVVSIKDNGIGIPISHQPMLFEQFSRADNAMKEYADGSGIGLYMVKILLDKINGSISFKSKPGTGTTFKVTLPLL